MRPLQDSALQYISEVALLLKARHRRARSTFPATRKQEPRSKVNKPVSNLSSQPLSLQQVISFHSQRRRKSQTSSQTLQECRIRRRLRHCDFESHRRVTWTTGKTAVLKLPCRIWVHHPNTWAPRILRLGFSQSKAVCKVPVQLSKPRPLLEGILM